jgi:hypothetical protein
MEIIAEFNDQKGVNLKLTKDKVFVSSIGNEETFALRSINGVGLYDDIAKYDRDLEAYKKKDTENKGCGISLIVVAALFGIIGISSKGGGFAFVFTILLGLFGYLQLTKKINTNTKPEPKLDSYFRLMISGNAQSFKFDKNDSNAGDVANFINNVEETLTAYHKD